MRMQEQAQGAKLFNMELLTELYRKERLGLVRPNVLDVVIMAGIDIIENMERKASNEMEQMFQDMLRQEEVKNENI